MIDNGINNKNENNGKDIVLLNIESFEELFDKLNNEKYTIKKLEQDIQNFFIESEKNNFICEKNKENKISNKKSLFGKFELVQNIYDFQITMSELLIKFYKFANYIKPENKKEYNILNKIFDIFSNTQSNNLMMSDIQCLIDNGVFSNYNNNFFIFIFEINDKYIKRLLSFFDIKSYFLSKAENINIFISKLNELINSYNEDNKQFLFIRKISILLTEIFNLFDDKDNNNGETYKIKTYKEKILNLVNKEKIFEIFFSDKEFMAHMDILESIFMIFTNEIDKQINILIEKKDKQITKIIMKFILKYSKLLKDYINEKTLFILNEFSIENSYKFHLNQYKLGKDRLINIYNKFKDKEKIIKLLVNYLIDNNKSEQAKLIENYSYNEKDEYELEEKEFKKINDDKYFKLPKDYIIYYISAEDIDYIKKSIDILDNIIKNKLNSDKYMGIDTEWKSSQTFYESYKENLNIVESNNSHLADIIQIAGINHGFIFDVKSIYKNKEIKEKIKQIFIDTKFIGFEFMNDANKLGEFFREIIYKNEFLDLSDIYKTKTNKKTPELKIITLEIFGKELDKRDQISDWSKRPLLQNQINYGILDAYILILINQKLKNI